MDAKLRFLSFAVILSPVTLNMYLTFSSFLPRVNDDKRILPKKFSFAEPSVAFLCPQTKIL